MPKSGKKIAQETRKQMVHRERQQRQERILYLSLGAVALVAILVLAIGYYQENIGKLNGPIATVNGTTITVREYQNNLRYNAGAIVNQLSSISTNMQQIGSDPSLSFLTSYYQQQQQTLASQLVSLPTSMLETLIEDQLVREEAARRNITVSADEIDQQIETDFNYFRATPTPTAGPSPTATATGTATAIPTATQTSTPAPTPTGTITPTLTPTITPTPGPTDTPAPTSTPVSLSSYQDSKKKFLDSLSKNNNISEPDFRKMVEVQLLRRKLQDAMAKEVPTSAEQVHARHILVPTYGEAISVTNQLKAGADFAKLAAQVSTDTGSKDKGGDLGWFARGQMIPEFENVAFSLAINQISEPVTSTYGVHIIQTLAHEQNRPLDATALSQKQSAALSDWLQTALNDPKNKIERFYQDAYVPADVKRAIASLTATQ